MILTRRSMLLVMALWPLISGAAEQQLVDVFVGGKDGYPAYRIPALVATQRGSLLAFAEGRASLREHAENDIVMKRSIDGGKTWGALQVIDEDGTNALNNPTAVVVRETGRVILMYQRYAKGFANITRSRATTGRASAAPSPRTAMMKV